MEPAALLLIMNILGIFIGFVGLISYILYEKKILRPILRPKVMTWFWTIFGITEIAYGIFILSIGKIIKEVYPGRYSIGGWIMISVGIILLIQLVVIKKIGLNKWD